MNYHTTIHLSNLNIYMIIDIMDLPIKRKAFYIMHKLNMVNNIAQLLHLYNKINSNKT